MRRALSTAPDPGVAATPLQDDGSGGAASVQGIGGDDGVAQIEPGDDRTRRGDLAAVVGATLGQDEGTTPKNPCTSTIDSPLNVGKRQRATFTARRSVGR